MKKNIVSLIFMLSTLSVIVLPSFSGNTVAHADESNSSDVVIYDKFGIEVSPEISSNLVTRAVVPPTTVKWLNNSASYQSENFSGSGTRYSGISFSSSTTNNFRLTFRLGGFGVNTIANPGNPSNVSQRYNLPLSGSPYTINTSGYFYFLVDNPRTGQNYHVQGIQ